MSKKHSSSYKAGQQKKDKRLNDPDFAGKKAVKTSSDDHPDDQSSSSQSNRKNNQNKAQHISQNSSRKNPKKNSGRPKSKAVSAKSLHNKDVQKQTATKKKPVIIPEDFSKKDESAGEKIVVKTAKSAKQDSATKNPKNSGQTKKPKFKPDIVAPEVKTKIDKQIPKPKTTENKPAQKAEQTQEPAPRKKFNWRKTWRRHPMPAILRIPCLILLLAGAAILFTWFIFWRTNSCDAELVAEFIGKKPMLFSYSCLIIFFLMAVVAAVTWHVFFTIGFSFAAASIITFISMQKFQLREEPLLPSDFVFAGQAGNLIGMVDAGAIWRLIGGVVLVLTGSILLEVYACKMLGKRTKGRPWWERHSLISRATYTAISLAGAVMVIDPLLKHTNPEWLEGFTKIAWDQTRTYGYNGFIIDFVSNMRKTAASKPDNYNRETIMKIAEKYWAIKEADDENRKPLDEVADRIFIILDESFYDPVIVKDYYDYGGKDVLPTTHKIFKNYPSGFMYSPGYGGGTANIEFEVQTGYSNYWSNSYPYIDVVPKSSSIQSAANWAKNYGFDTKAIHAYWGEMYNRTGAYPILGYDDFIDIDEMTINRNEPGTPWPNDNSIFDEALDLTDGKSPVLVNIVTMQNHGGYSYRPYSHFDFVVRNSEHNNDEMTNYFQLLHASDTYLEELIEDLEKSKERTVILWFGDHAAGLFPELAESDDKSKRDLTRLTPYFIWANFDLESDSKKAIESTAKKNAELGFDLSMVGGVDLPTTTPNCLLNQLYNTLGAEKPAMFYLLDIVCEEAPIITGSYYESDTDFPTGEAIKEYELINYDIMNGQQYWDGE